MKLSMKGNNDVFPTLTDTVTVNYEGLFLNGEVFDKNQNISFPLDKVISGWTEGLQLMTPGATFKFYIPSHLAYGERGSSGIPPYSILIFEVELLEVK